MALISLGLMGKNGQLPLYISNRSQWDTIVNSVVINRVSSACLKKLPGVCRPWMEVDWGKRPGKTIFFSLLRTCALSGPSELVVSSPRLQKVEKAAEICITSPTPSLLQSWLFLSGR